MQDQIFIGIFGRTNQGKSSLMNLLTGQNTSIISDIPGTTTDPVKKSIELEGLGKTTLIDTAGIDDGSPLGEKRQLQSHQMLKQIDAALLVITQNSLDEEDKNLLRIFEKEKIPCVLVHNKEDLVPLSREFRQELLQTYPQTPVLGISTHTRLELEKKKIVQALQAILLERSTRTSVLQGIVQAQDTVVLVTPIDSEAPQNRLILPQVQIARQCLDLHALCLMCQPQELTQVLSTLKNRPKLVITDSQAFKEVNEMLPPDYALTSFSICLAKEKGNFKEYLQGSRHIDKLQDGDKILLLESCTHHPNCEDIGRVKLPRLLSKYTGKKLEFEFSAGLSPLPQDIDRYALVIQCGGCMITAKQLEKRLAPFIEKHIPVSNYGMTLAYVNGIFHKAVRIFETEG